MPHEKNAAKPCADDSPQTLEELFVALESQLLLYAIKVAGDQEVAKDLVQEAFLKLHPRFEEVLQPRAWLYTTIHNLAMNYHRSRRRLTTFDEVPQGQSADGSALPDDQVERLEAVHLAREFLHRLDEKHRQVILLKFERNMSYKEISAETGLSVGNVGYILHHGLKELAWELEKVGVTPWIKR